MSNSQNTRHPQHTEHNKPAASAPTQRHEAQRTPESRNDREAHLGSANQTNARKGGAPNSR